VRRLALLLALLLALVAGCGGEPPVAAPLAQDGLVYVMRHAAAEPKTDAPERLPSCATQRALTRAGREQARRIGAALREAGVPVRDVRASPMRRTMDTARLALGRATPDDDLLMLAIEGSTTADDARRTAALRARVCSAPAGTWLVTHTPNIGEALGLSLAEGEVVGLRRGRPVVRLAL
jgi:phosphohistidine phosphatase SixA